MQTATRKPGKPARAEARPLEDLLADLVSAHEWLRRASGAQREAIRRADPTEMARSRDEMSAACARITGLEQERLAAVAAIAPERPDATLTSLAALLPGPRRTRALELAATLRNLIIQAQKDQARLRAATDSMLRHVRGMVQHVQRSLNHSGVYGRAGRVEPGAAVVSGIDLTR